MTKQTIRKTIGAQNRAMSSKHRAEASEQIITQLNSLETLAQAKCVAIFISLPDEVESAPIIEWLAAGREIVIPRIDGDQMEFYPISSLEVGSFGIMEPTSGQAIDISEIDVIIAPGVAFTAAGGRLGRGKGFYDRYLRREGLRAEVIGVGYAHQLLEQLPLEEHDVLMDRIIVG